MVAIRRRRYVEASVSNRVSTLFMSGVTITCIYASNNLFALLRTTSTIGLFVRTRWEIRVDCVSLHDRDNWSIVKIGFVVRQTQRLEVSPSLIAALDSKNDIKTLRRLPEHEEWSPVISQLKRSVAKDEKVIYDANAAAVVLPIECRKRDEVILWFVYFGEPIIFLKGYPCFILIVNFDSLDHRSLDRRPESEFPSFFFQAGLCSEFVEIHPNFQCKPFFFHC